MNARKFALIAAHPASIIAAAWAITHVGLVPVGFGLMAPAGVYFVGLTLVLRDLVQRHVGKAVAFALILAGAALSALISPAVAVASGVAFLASESVDFAVFTLLERRGELRAIVASNAVSLAVDSALFLTLAFGSLAFLPGQIVGKALATIAAVAFLAALKARRAVTA